MNTKHDDEPAAVVADEPDEPTALAAPQTDVVATVEEWWGEFFPETGGPVSYMSGEWHHCLAAKDELIRRLAGPPAPAVPEGE